MFWDEKLTNSGPAFSQPCVLLTPPARRSQKSCSKGVWRVQACGWVTLFGAPLYTPPGAQPTLPSPFHSAGTGRRGRRHGRCDERRFIALPSCAPRTSALLRYRRAPRDGRIAQRRPQQQCERRAAAQGASGHAVLILAVVFLAVHVLPRAQRAGVHCLVGGLAGRRNQPFLSDLMSLH